MIVIADTSPICYLVIIGKIELLPQLFGKILVPCSVYKELTAKGSPTEVQSWMNTPPKWLEICSVTMLDDPMLKHLHPGEKEAIMLAEQLRADLIILDEKAARKAAQQKKLKVTGLLGILDVAASLNLVEISSAIQALQKTNFRAESKLLTFVLNRHQRSD
ncbi:DUF3368 domain-containing protein [Anabaenopsis sp. FSS-46]|uniref:DUF3368 domain-containing protein n=1 Tax=Anabaenopsis sp. FSS-46 TaxID=2971766 RepID=UPI002474EF8D|nr:DUF3368 domain-containing protein [Anabaenopsis sp. FSS-46]MDH6098020.1 DUF3368 domain-containing protein [Anabaenopsis sp. FSS-46]